MNVQELLDQFRSDAFDLALPYLWSDTDVLRYMNDAYGMFVRLTGGIGDFTTVENRVASGTLTVTGSSGSFTSVTVNGVDILGVTVTYLTSPTITATSLAAQINATGNLVYSASSAGAVVTLTTRPNQGAMSNGWAVASTGTCSATYAAMSNGVSTGTLTVTGSSGSFTSVTVNGVDILGAGVAYTTSPTVTAANLAAQINLAAAASLNPFFTASSVGAVVTLTTNPGFGEMPNGWAVASTGTCSATYVAMHGGVNGITQVAIVAGSAVGTYDKRIMRIMKAYRATDQSEIDIKAQGDMTFSRDNDYGMVRPVYMDRTQGQVRYMIIGSERGKCRWVQVPLTNDTAQLYVFRKPLVNIDPTAPDLAFEFDGVDEVHHTHLALWMRRCAHLKQDAETFDKGKASEFEALFNSYCNLAKAEMDRERAKPRAVAYGGV